MINKEKLYQTAYAFKNEKLWALLSDEQIFAVQHKDGTISYCSVLGRLGQQYALNVYTGPEGLTTYKRLIEFASKNMGHADEDPFVSGELTCMQECLSCSFENLELVEDDQEKEIRKYAKKLGINLRLPNMYACMYHMTPGVYPYLIQSEKDVEIMGDALEAGIVFSRQIHEGKIRAIEILPQSIAPSIFLLSRRNGKWEIGETKLPDVKFSYPAPQFNNELIQVKIKKLKKTETWQMGMIYGSFYVGNPSDPQKHAFFPLILMAFTEETNYVRVVHTEDENQEDPQKFLADLADQIVQSGTCPKIIRCRDERCYHFLEDFCRKTGIEIDDKGNTSSLLGFEKDFCDHMNSQAAASGEDETLPEVMMEAVFENIRQMSDREMLSLPMGVKQAIKNLSIQGLLPPDLNRRVKKLLK